MKRGEGGGGREIEKYRIRFKELSASLTLHPNVLTHNLQRYYPQP